MGKKQQQAQNQTNKSHKTLRDKLRKRREQLKKHKKQKSEKHKHYDANQKKKNFFQQANVKKKKRQDGIKEHKLNKYIEKFVDIYEDDIEDFYQLFQTLDQGGKIDITDVADPAMQKCLKKLFKYLPLNKKKLQYQKKQGVQTKLYSLMKQLVTKSIQNYMQNGTDQERNDQNNGSQKQSSDQNINQDQKKHKSKKKIKRQAGSQQQFDKQAQKKKKMQLQNKSIREYQKLVLYQQRNLSLANNNNEGSIGPCISAEQRQYIAKMFSQQSKNLEQQSQQNLNAIQIEQNNQFQRIFSMTTQSKRSQNQTAKSQPRANIDDIPQQLLAQGSARIGQKQQINPSEIQEYDKIHRPRKLIEQYQQMKKLGKYAEVGADGTKKRAPFNRQRDIVNGRSRPFMNNGVFFDFKERMSKPKSNSNFL